jgi:hypothetical protein
MKRTAIQSSDTFDLIYERRRLERFNLEVPARIEILTREEHNPEILELNTKDVSAGGAYFRTKKALPEGTRVRIDIILPLDRLRKLKDTCKGLIKVTGTVLRSEPTGMAVSFDEGYLITPFGERLS